MDKFSFKTKTEILVHFQLLKNIDLLQQGVYSFRVSLQNLSDKQFAQPYLLLKDLGQQQLHTKLDKAYLPSSYINDYYFNSRSVEIRYEDEMIDEYEGCVFKCEVDTFQPEEFVLTIEMLLIELKKMDKSYDQDKIKQELRQVSKVEIRLKDLNQFQVGLIPIEFDRMHCCLLKTSLNILPLDFKVFDAPVHIDKTEAIIILEQLIEMINSLANKFTQHYKQCIKEYLSDPSMFGKYLKLVKQNAAEEQDQVFQDIENEKISKDQFIQETHKKLFKSSTTLYSLWIAYLEFYLSIDIKLCHSLFQEYCIKMKCRWGQFIVSNVYSVLDLGQYNEPETRNRQAISQQIRQQQQQIKQMEVEDYIPNPKIQPILFKDTYLKSDVSMKLQGTKGQHLFVFVHGFKGGQYDLRLWKNAIKLRYGEKEVLTFTARSNAGVKSEDDINEMGQRLASELRTWMINECPKENFKKISFIAHSIGGLVVRAALPYLEKLKDRMYTLITLGTPHLGYLVDNTKTHVKSGLWIIRNFQQTTSLIQLCHDDSKNIENSLLYRMSQYQGLNWFRNLVLVSSAQDEFVPLDIAHIQRSTSVKSDSIKGQCYNRMINNLLNDLSTDRIHRFEVNFIIDQNYSKWDSMIGRAAHMELIENMAFIRMFISNFDEYFE